MGSYLKRPAAGSVKINDVFWSEYLDNIRRVMMPYVFDKLIEVGYLANFASVAAGDGAPHRGPHFSDGLLLESIRGACDFLSAEYDSELDARLDSIISVIASASDASPDGFLHTWTMQVDNNKRWGHYDGDIIYQHDLYNQGALVEAGISHYLATGKTTLLKCAVKAANNICREIGSEEGKLNVIPGHSLPEEAFVKLYRLFRDTRELDGFAAELSVDPKEYLRVARFWYDWRGVYDGRSLSKHFTREYNQDTAPFADQRIAVGHAVRAMLCYTGAAAVMSETGAPYREALDALWDNVVHRKMHISGGIGSRHDIEGFDVDYNLPNNAYLETCAGVGLAFWAAEMNLLHPDSEYYDVFERAVCNNVLAAVGDDFRHYFYQNPLVSDGSIRRWDWHSCPCCPPMLLKLWSSFGSNIYSYKKDNDGISLYVNMYIDSSYSGDGFEICRSGDRISVNSGDLPVILALRIPEYVDNFTVKLNSKPVNFEVRNGYAVLKPLVMTGDDVLTAAFVTPARCICASPAVEANRGKVAFMKGQYLYCAEGIDNNGVTDRTISDKPNVRITSCSMTVPTADGELKLIPYHKWCSRNSGGERDSVMQVWFNRENMSAPEYLNKAMKGALYADYDRL